MQCCRLSLGTDMRRRKFITWSAAPRRPGRLGRRAAAGEKPQGRTAPSGGIYGGERFGCDRCLETIMRGEVMKIVVIGGTGLIGGEGGEKVKQKREGANTTPANTGGNTITPAGVKDAT